MRKVAALAEVGGCFLEGAKVGTKRAFIRKLKCILRPAVGRPVGATFFGRDFNLMIPICTAPSLEGCLQIACLNPLPFAAAAAVAHRPND